MALGAGGVDDHGKIIQSFREQTLVNIRMFPKEMRFILGKSPPTFNLQGTGSNSSSENYFKFMTLSHTTGAYFISNMQYSIYRTILNLISESPTFPLKCFI